MNDKLKQGETLFAQGRVEEAEKCFVEVSEHQPNNIDAYNNLGVIAFQRQNINLALEYFTKALEIDPIHQNTIINYATILRDLNLLHEIAPIVEKALEKTPEDQELFTLLEEMRQHQQPRPKMLVTTLTGFETFLGDIVDSLRVHYDVRTCYSTSKSEIEENIRWSEIVWLDWANELVIELTNHSDCLNRKRVICRLHSYEAFHGFVEHIRWEKISDLIFVADHIKKIVLHQAPDLPSRVQRIHLVPNGVNLKKFPFRERSKGTNLAYLGNINYKKGPMLLLHTFRELVQADPEYKLFIAGKIQNARYELYFAQMIREMGLEKNIQLVGWVDNVPKWLEDKHYVVCTSVLEGHPVGLMEAMACGLKPLIHNYVGAKNSYPEKYLWNTIPEFVHMTTEDEYNSMEYHSFIECNYSLSAQLERIATIVDPLTEDREVTI